jgi:hypothetical protein
VHLELQLKELTPGSGISACPRVSALLNQRGLHAEPLFRQPRTREMASYYVVVLPADAMAATVRDEALATGEVKGAYVVPDSRRAGSAGRSRVS